MIDVAGLHPLIVPRAYIETGSWDLPHVGLPNQAFILTWVEYGEMMTYLDRQAYVELEASGHNWQRQALDNVRQTEYFHRHRKEDEQGRLEWIAFLNDEDTISSSKVLLHFELSRIFPEGYLVALPDRACGLIISALCTGDALDQVRHMVEQMYTDADTPMSPHLYSPADFLVPTDWTEPFSADPSSIAILNSFGL